MPPERRFPFTPRSATQLRIGDLIGVQASSGRWGCLQVVDLEPRARVNLWAGVLDWAGGEPPTEASTAGSRTLDAPLTGIELFTQGRLQVHATGLVAVGSPPSNRTVQGVGTVHQVSGWKARIQAAQERADGTYAGWLSPK